jgi:CDP-glucose 4,6-dehydratase
MENLVRPLATYYQGKKVFLTGHTGFKGSWLLLWLYSLGATVKGYALEACEKGIFRKIEGGSLCESTIHNIRDAKKLEEEIISFQPDYIFHLAAQPLVRLSYEIPQETYEVNVNGTINLLEALRKLPGRCSLIVITTDKVYENKEQDYAYKEDDKLGGHDPYSASKAAAEIVVSSYRNSFFHHLTYKLHQKSVAVARAGNVIGGGDYSKDRIIPDIVSALENNNEVPVRNPLSVRPWQHVLEPLWGYLQLGASLTDDPVTKDTAFNFGPDLNDAITVEELVKEAIGVWGNGSYTKIPYTNAVHEAGLLKLDNTKAKQLLGVYPVYSSIEAIGKTMDWYKNAATGGYRDFSLSQIMQFCKKLNGI